MTKGIRSNSFLIWDSNESCPITFDGTVILWRQFEEKSSTNVVSIHDIIERFDDQVKGAYLAFTHELANTKIKGKRLLDILTIKNGFSFWYTSDVYTMTSFKGGYQFDAVGILALDYWISSTTDLKISIFTKNSRLQSAIAGWCKKKGCNIHILRYNPISRKVGLSSRNILLLTTSIYELIKAIIILLSWLVRSRFFYNANLHLNSANQKLNGISFFGYLTNSKEEEDSRISFESAYWGALPRFCRANKQSTCWFHMWIKTTNSIDSGQAFRYTTKLNKRLEQLETHILLESCLSRRILGKALVEWMSIALKLIRIIGRIEKQVVNNSYLWCLHEKALYVSLLGIAGISNTLYLNIFEELLDRMPRQRLGFYLQENLGWEYCLIYAWRKAGHGQIIGVPHTTISYWDLRYFRDKREYLESDHSLMPDLVALNGPHAIKSYLQWGYPHNQIREVEAVRFQNDGITATKRPSVNDSCLCLLVLGEYLLSDTQRQLRLLNDAIKFGSHNLEIVLKLHPACFLNKKNDFLSDIIITNEPLQDLFERFTTVLTGCTSSVSLDAYLAGLNVISLLDPTKLNMNPLRNNSDITFVKSAEELSRSINCLLDNNNADRHHSRYNSYFTYNTNLPLWQSIISGDIVN